LELILSEEDPYDIWEKSVKYLPPEPPKSQATICIVCKFEISPFESRIRDFTNEEIVLWIHKNCRK